MCCVLPSLTSPSSAALSPTCPNADVLAAGLSLLAASRIPLADVSYLGWFLMAVKAGLVCLTVETAVMALAHRKELAELTERFRSKPFKWRK